MRLFGALDPRALLDCSTAQFVPAKYFEKYSKYIKNYQF